MFLAAGGASLGLGLSFRGAQAKAGAFPPAPVARVAVVKDSHFGETLSDPYRWMEDYEDPDWLPFLRGQNDHTRAVLDAIPNRKKLLERIQSLSGALALTSTVQRAGGKLFFQQRPAGADNYKLFVRDGSGKARGSSIRSS